MNFDVRKTDLTKLNSLTKYPAIPTYHTLDPKNGGLLEEAVAFEGTVLGTEKIDGTNARIICLPDGNYILGSREELLYGRGDLIGNPALGIAEAMKGPAEKLCGTGGEGIRVFYFEVFGGKVSAASKQYTGEQRVSFRLFDAMRFSDYKRLLSEDLQGISLWREAAGQTFVGENELQALSAGAGMPLTPRLFSVDASDLPRSIAEMVTFLKEKLPSSRSTLDGGAGGRPEGIVLRTLSRSVIAKARFEDYERTLKRRGNR